MIEVKKTSDLKNNFVAKILIFGRGKVGKTSLALTLDLANDNELVYIGFDPGSLSLRERDFRVLGAPNNQWTPEILEETYQYLVDNASNIKFIFVDGIDDLGNSLLKSAKLSTTNIQKAYGEMAEVAEDWIKRVRDIHGPTTIFVTHEDIVTDEATNTTSFFPSFPGKKLRNKLNQLFDLIGYYHLSIEDGKPKRKIIFRPEYNPAYQVGDRSGVLDNFEDPNLQGILNKIVDSGIKINDNSPRLVTHKDIEGLVSWAKKNGISKSQWDNELAILFPSRLVVNLNIDEFNRVKNSLLSKSNKKEEKE